MKKSFFLLTICILFLSARSFAAWEYCRYSQQINSDAWRVYIQKTWTGGGIGANPFTEYRYDRYDALTNTYTSTGWIRLPANGYIGDTGLGTGISNLEIRHPNLFDPTAPPLFQAFVDPC